MFQKQEVMTNNREIGREPETIISASVKLEGDFVSKGNVLIEGEVEGSLKTEQDLRVGEQARITADVAAACAIVAGEVRGNLEVKDRLELEPTAKIFGDIKTSDLVVASGAVICGRITMGDGTSSSSTKSVRSAKSAKAGAGTDLDDLSVEDIATEPVKEKESVGKKTVNAFFSR